MRFREIEKRNDGGNWNLKFLIYVLVRRINNSWLWVWTITFLLYHWKIHVTAYCFLLDRENITALNFRLIMLLSRFRKSYFLNASQVTKLRWQLRIFNKFQWLGIVLAQTIFHQCFSNWMKYSIFLQTKHVYTNIGILLIWLVIR